MTRDLQLRLNPATAYTPECLCSHVAHQLDIESDRIKDVKILRRSIDARQRQVVVSLEVRVYIDEVPQAHPLFEPINYRRVAADAPQCIVVGAGPAGLFAALELIESGVRPIVLERGKDVDARRKDIARIAREGTVDPDSNYCFGEGGAGAYSDGKLYTRSKKRGSVEKILRVFHQHGAQEEILVDAHPHIGTDRLPEVIKAMRGTIERCGGMVEFGARVTELIVDNGRVDGAVTADGRRFQGPVIIATGHSARDVYEMLMRQGLELEAKGLAVGVRLEHPQKLIDKLRYHSNEGRGRYLPAAEYSLLTRVDGRAVYSFCMCPGGIVISSASQPGQSVVNGMSPSNRGSRWANSGMVVEILPEDVEGSDPLRMMRFQESIEHAFFQAAGQTQRAPAQRMTDFVDGRPSPEGSLARSSYAPGLIEARVDRLLPEGVALRLRKGFAEFGRKQRGFLTPEATVIGCETRTSSPVRIPRDGEHLMSVAIEGLYPCGEGAGYAGGIVSAAIDGCRCARAVAETIAETAKE